MSHGFVSINSLSLRVLRHVHGYKDVHACTNNASALIGYDRVHSYINVADMVINMDKPRTISTFLPDDVHSAKVMSQLVEWCDPEDTIINFSNETYKNSNIHKHVFGTKDIHYMSAGISGDTLMVGGNEHVFGAQELFFRMFSGNVVHCGKNPGDGHVMRMIMKSAEYTITQGYSEILDYLNQDTDALTKSVDNDVCCRLLKTLNYKRPTEDAPRDCIRYSLDKDIPIPVLSMALNAYLTDKHCSFVNKCIPYNKFADHEVAMQTLRFLYAMTYHECSQFSHKFKECVKGSKIDCAMFSNSNVYDVMDETSQHVRGFIMHSAKCGIPVPTIQAALCNYDAMRFQRSMDNYISKI